MINELLLQLGLNEKEIAIYLCLLQKGDLSATAISRSTKINRTTIYGILHELIDKGLLNEDQSTTPSAFLALPPQELKAIIRREEQKLQHKANVIDQLIPQLFTISKESKYTPPKIKFTAEEDLDAYLRHSNPIWIQSTMKYDKTMWGVQDPTFIEHYFEFIKWQQKNHNLEGLEFKLISQMADIEKNPILTGQKNRAIYFWEEIKEITASTWIAGDYIIMCMSQKRPHYLIEIYDQTLAHNLREVFKALWNTVTK